MKNIKPLRIVLGLLLLASLTSCQKDTKTGAFVPAKKIRQIYIALSGENKEPFQHWDWNGDHLSSITHYGDFEMKDDVWVENFTYENNRITRVDNYTNSEYITYSYDGDHLKSATVFYRNAIACTWAISYDGDKITKMTGTFYDGYKKAGGKMQLNPLSHLLPPNISDNIVKHEQRMASQWMQKDNHTIVLLLTWTGDNINKIIYTADGEYMDFQLQYDDKNSPWYGFLGGLEDYLINLQAGHTGFNKNNVTSMITTEGQYSDTLNFAYQYDGDQYPILQTVYNIGDIDDKLVFYVEY